MVKRRSLSLLFAIATFIVSVTCCLTASSLSKDTYGDVDHDGSTTSADALSVLRCSADMTQFDESELSIADVDNDGVITSSDAINILRASVLAENNSDNSDTVSQKETVSSEPQKQEEVIEDKTEYNYHFDDIDNAIKKNEEEQEEKRKAEEGNW